MRYVDYFFRFDTELQAEALLESHGLTVDGNPIRAATIRRVGLIAKGGEWDVEGEEVVAPTVLDGWHVNLRHDGALTDEQMLSLGAYRVNPVAPYAVFA